MKNSTTAPLFSAVAFETRKKNDCFDQCELKVYRVCIAFPTLAPAPNRHWKRSFPLSGTLCQRRGKVMSSFKVMAVINAEF